MMKIENFQYTRESKISGVQKTQSVFKDAKNLRFLSMNKKGIVSMHAGLFFIIGIILGAGLVYYAFTQGWLPIGGPST